MKQRNLLTIVLLGYFTLGIYSIYWLYATRKGLVEKLGDKKAIPPLSLIFLPYALLVLGLVLAIALAGDTLANVVLILLGLIGVIAIPVVLIYWFYKYAHALHQVTQGQDPVLHLILIIIMWSVGLGPIWMLLAQNDINKYLESGAGATTAPATPVPTQPAISLQPTPRPEQQPPAAEQPPAPQPNEDTTPKV